MYLVNVEFNQLGRIFQVCSPHRCVQLTPVALQRLFKLLNETPTFIDEHLLVTQTNPELFPSNSTAQRNGGYLLFKNRNQFVFINMPRCNRGTDGPLHGVSDAQKTKYRQRLEFRQQGKVQMNLERIDIQHGNALMWNIALSLGILRLWKHPLFPPL